MEVHPGHRELARKVASAIPGSGKFTQSPDTPPEIAASLALFSAGFLLSFQYRNVRGFEPVARYSAARRHNGNPLANQTDLELDDILGETELLFRRVRILSRVQTTLITGCWIALIVGAFLLFQGGYSEVVTYLGIIGGSCGFGGFIVGKSGQSLCSKAQENANALKHLADSVFNNESDGGGTAIPLTIGFANLSGADFDSMVSEDAEALSPLFARSRIVGHQQIPSAEILFVYAHLNNDGTIRGPDSSGIRQVVQLTNAAIVVLASPNSTESVQNAVSLPGPKTASIVFTLDRNGNEFSRFFRDLFAKMRSGKDMLTAWVELAPQHPDAGPSCAPETILLAEGGNVTFAK